MPARYALFSTGAGLGRAALGELERLGLAPRALVLPGYPPAPRPAAADGLAVDPPSAATWPGEDYRERTLYVPRRDQADGARRLAGYRCDFLLVACWPWLIGAELRGAVAAAALNLHPSLLPAWRGPRPLAAQLAAGERRFGVTLHLLDDRFDHGDIVARRTLEEPGGEVDEAALEAACGRLGARLFAAAMRAWPDWEVRRQPPVTD